MLHYPNYTDHCFAVNDHIDIGFTGYPSYPKQVFDHSDYLLIFEGMIYNYDENILSKELQQLAEAFVGSNAFPLPQARRLLLNADGEFIIVVYNKLTNRIMAVNDRMGRLPLYYYKHADFLVFSRELKFLLPFLQNLRPNKAGIMEYLLYGYPFEENTLIEKACFFPSASYLDFDLSTGHFVKAPYYVMNLEDHVQTGTRRQIISNMRALFLTGLKNRIARTPRDNIIVSLSGGMDSRGTLAGLKELNCHPVAVTATNDEEGFARNVAEDFQTDIYPIAQKVERGPLDYKEIVFLKDGLDCHPDLAQLHYNLHDLREHFGEDAIYYTGIYGGEITRHIHPTAGLRSVDSLAEYLMNARDSCKYSTHGVAALFQVTSHQLKQRLIERLEAFPEKNIYKKYLRFRHECNMRFTGEAEDRNRYYFWTISPYFSTSFFQYVMAIDENRKSIRLFRDFLFSINPATCKQPYYDLKLPLNNVTILFVSSMMQRAARHVWVKGTIRKLIRLIKSGARLMRPLGKGEYENRAFLKSELLRMLHESETTKRHFNHSGMRAIISNENDSQGLERLRIVFVYLSYAMQWHQMIKSPERGQTSVPIKW